MKFILGKKIEMSQMFDEKGNVIPVTLIEAGPCYVTQVKTKEKDGYEAVQLGFLNLKKKKVKKPQKDRPYKYLKEFRVSNLKLNVGEKIDVSVFKEGDLVKVSGTSKGKGFAGAVKKWHFKGRSPTHGTKHEEKSIGSIGCRFPQRVIKGKKMPGRMGTERVTVKNLKVVKIDPVENLLVLKGAVPGRRSAILEIVSEN